MTDTRLRILHVVCTDEFAGVEQFITRLALAQAAVGHEVSVAGGDPVRMRSKLKGSGIAFAPVSSIGSATRAIRARIASLDVINSHMTAADAAAILAVTGRRRRPALVSTRHFAKRRGRFASLDPLIGPWFDADIAISEYVARAINVPSTVVYPGIEPRPSTDFESRQRVVLMAQRLQPEKQSLVGIRAFAASGLADLGWTLNVAGDGPERWAAQRLSEELGVTPATRFLGFRDDVGDLMAHSSILLATCPIEGFGLSVLEAMASGLSVVAPDRGGPAEMLAGLDPRALFRAGDAGHAGKQLRSLAEDEDGRAAFGAAARRRQSSLYTVVAQEQGTSRVYSVACTAPR